MNTSTTLGSSCEPAILLHHSQRLFAGHTVSVGPVRRHGVKGVCNGKDSRRERQLAGSGTFGGIALGVVTVMVIQHRVVYRVGKTDAVDDLTPHHRMLLD